MIFPQAGLGLVDSQRNGGSRGQAEIRDGQALFVHAVTAFMQHAEKRGGEIRFVITGGHAHVPRPKCGAKRMSARIDAPGLEIKSDRRGDLGIESLLGRYRIGSWRQT